MASSNSGFCWPSRFPMWLTALFLASLVIGMVLAAIFRTPANHEKIQIFIDVYVRSGGSLNKTKARLFYGKSEQDYDKDQDLGVFPGNRSQEAGPINMVVFVLDSQGQITHPGYPLSFVWPAKKGKTLTIILDPAKHTATSALSPP